MAYLNCQPFPPRRGPSTKCTPSTRPGSRRRHCRHCSEPGIRRGSSIRPAEYSSRQFDSTCRVLFPTDSMCTKTLVAFKVILKRRCSRSSIGMATSTTAKKSTWSPSLEGSRSPILDGGKSTPGPDSSSSTMLLVITTTRSIDGHLANPMVLTPFSLPPSKQVTGILG